MSNRVQHVSIVVPIEMQFTIVDHPVRTTVVDEDFVPKLYIFRRTNKNITALLDGTPMHRLFGGLHKLGITSRRGLVVCPSTSRIVRVP